MNKKQPKSIEVSQYQSESIIIDQDQTKPNAINIYQNHYKPLDINQNLSEFRSNQNPFKSKYQSKSNSINQNRSASVKLNLNLSELKPIWIIRIHQNSLGSNRNNQNPTRDHPEATRSNQKQSEPIKISQNQSNSTNPNVSKLINYGPSK